MKSELLGFKAPKKNCTSKKCPFHGTLNVKKEIIRGKVVKKDPHHSATIEWNRLYYIPKYERFEFRRSRLRVHNPPCLDAPIDQEVIAAKTRPLSKNKGYVIIHIIKKEEIKENNKIKENKKQK